MVNAIAPVLSIVFNIMPKSLPVMSIANKVAQTCSLSSASITSTNAGKDTVTSNVMIKIT